MIDDDDMVRGTAREWFWARIVFIGGFVIAVAVAGYFAWQRHQGEIAARQQAAAQVQSAQQQQQLATQQSQASANARAGLMLCAMELSNAKSMGIIPPYGQLAAAAPRETKKIGRYSCTAATQVSKYEIQADLVCKRLADPKCVKLYSVKSDDGTVLYTNTK